MDQTSTDDLIELSQLLNYLLQEYYKKTQDIALLLKDDEESLEKTNKILQERETIINRFNIIKEKYESMKSESNSPELSVLQEQRQELLELLKVLESSNLSKANDLSDGYKDKIREINTGKKAIQAYSHSSPLSDGFFVDKRK